MQYKWLEVPPARPGVNDTWTLGVFADSAVVGVKPVPFVLRASCPGEHNGAQWITLEQTYSTV